MIFTYFWWLIKINTYSWVNQRLAKLFLKFFRNEKQKQAIKLHLLNITVTKIMPILRENKEEIISRKFYFTKDLYFVNVS